MSFVIACPICGAAVSGPTAPPRRDDTPRVIVTECRRCDTALQFTLHVLQLGARSVVTLITDKR